MSDDEAFADYDNEYDPEMENDTALSIANLLTHFQGQLDQIEIMSYLPVGIKNRVKALKKIQFDMTKIEAENFKEIHSLECKFHELHVPDYEKRAAIIKGDYEPSDEESLFHSDGEGDAAGGDEDVKGIPNFWLTIFANVRILRDMVQPYDVPILKHLMDIKLFIKEEPMGFLLEFHFEPNEYFYDTVLTKEYFMKCELDDSDPFNFEGPEIYKCVGCKINWKPGKNVTIKFIRKRQKHKTLDVTRTVTKSHPNDSFFNFFAPPMENSALDGEDEDLRNLLLTCDFEIGHYIKEHLIPRAVYYFTGEAVEREEEEYYDDEDDDDDDDDDDDESDDSDNTPTNQEVSQ